MIAGGTTTSGLATPAVGFGDRPTPKIAELGEIKKQAGSLFLKRLQVLAHYPLLCMYRHIQNGTTDSALQVHQQP